MKKYLILILWLASIPLYAQTVLTIAGQTYTNGSTGTWEGVNISRSVPTTLTFKNNSITSVNTDGYMLQAGDDADYGWNNHLDGAVITGNKLTWNGTDMSCLTHGIITGYSINETVRYNYVDKAPYAYIFKSGDESSNMSYTSGGCSYNISRNGHFSVRIKGINNVPIYNNTFYYGSGYGWYVILITPNTDNTNQFDPTGIKIKNNIFYSYDDIDMIEMGTGSTTGFECDYNVYYIVNSVSHEPSFLIGETSYTWTQWKALGYDAHSVVMNPNFINTTGLVPAARLDYGTNLGSSWNTGLSTGAVWGVSDPETAAQNGSWQVGARVYVASPSSSAHYVSTTGSDSNPGTFASPWLTWGKAFTSTSVGAGDTVYIRGGVYMMTVTNGDGYGVTRAGTSGAWIVYCNYPGEVPILDCSAIAPSGAYNSGAGMSTSAGANYVKFKGLTVRNVYQVYSNREITAAAFGCENGFFTFENCTAYNIDGHGFESYFYNGSPTVNGEHYFINCDAYNCVNTKVYGNELPGNKGVGFAAQNWYGTEGRSYAINCRAWKCGDQGFSWNGDQYCEADGCWSFNNGVLQGDGHGFKLGWHDRVYSGPNEVVKNCIVAYNRMSGMTTNDDDQGIATGMNIYNNTAYHNGYKGGGYDYSPGFYILSTPDTPTNELKRIFRNNISYANEGGAVTYSGGGTTYTHDHNTWDATVTVTNADFLGVDSAGIAGPRQADGSLPDLDFLKLVSTSDLIDKGVDVGIAYEGTAPDLGFNEYGVPNDPINPVVIYTNSVTSGVTTATTGGNVTDDGGGSVTARGVCWSLSSNPVITGSHTSNGSGVGTFVSSITGLTASTTYHVRAYATNEAGTGYGADVQFTTTSQTGLSGDFVFFNGKKVYSQGKQVIK